ncbi:MAG: elongation factor G [Gammaproteobacteria bacterium]|nr:elongation factor G [Gammaproteobacteria bacterium]
MAYSTKDILNLALVGAASAGKTSVTEAMLHKAGVINALGSVDAKTSVSDYLDREKRMQHSLQPTICSFDFNERHINLIDCPGYPDFIGRMLSILPAVESVAIVVDATSGIDSHTVKIAQHAAARQLCRMVIVNKIDGEGVDLEALTEQIKESLGSECLPINLPNADCSDVIDCFFDSGEGETNFSSIEEAHEQIIDQVVEIDEGLMELYLEEGELPAEKLHEAFEQALREGHLIPICFTSALAGGGVSDLLTVMSRLMPNPTEGNPPQFVQAGDENGEAVDLSSSDHVLSHVFKVVEDQFKGRMALLRVHQGTVVNGSQLYVHDERKGVKVQHLTKLCGQEQTEVDQVVAGDICAIPRAEDVAYNAVLHDSHDEDNIRMKLSALPIPVYGLAISTPDDSNAQKVSEALHTLSVEDPSLNVDHVVALNETVLRGIGEMHLRVVLEELRDDHGLTIDTRVPAIEYRETITAAAEGHHRHKKQSGGAGQFGEVYLRVEPMPRGEGFVFEDNVVGGVIPGQFIPAVEKGILQVMESGAISGHEMQDIRVSVYDGKHHSVDSKEIAFVQAGKRAFMDAVGKARPIVMEPVVDINLNVPNHCMGDVAGDLSSMGGMVNGSEVQADNSVEIQGQAPLRELQTYHSRLSSISGGHGTYSMQFSHYAPVQAQLQKELAASFQPVEEE